MKGLFKLLTSMLACAIVLSSISSCDVTQVQGNNSNLDSTSSNKDVVGYPSYIGSGESYWSPIYLTTSAMKKDSYFGASGDNIKAGITVLEKATDVLLVATLNAGVIRSSDAGALWQNSGVGINSLGVDAIAADPNNYDFVIAVSTSSSQENANGIYISNNEGHTWERLETSPQFPTNSSVEILFDKSSYNGQTNQSSVIYLTVKQPTEQGESFLLRSDDSGNNFKVVRTINPKSTIAIHPTKSYVYLADDTGFYRSINRGFSFDLLREGKYDNVLVSPSTPDNVWLLSENNMVTSKNSGQDFEEDVIALPSGTINEISISPTDANHMVASVDTSIVYTSNGGSTWHDSAVYDNPHKMSADTTYVEFAWSVSSPAVYVLLNNAIYKSVDNGAFFTWSGNGDDSFTMNGFVSQNIHSPSYMAFAIDNKTIATTDNGGSTWNIRSYDDYETRLNIKAVYPLSRSKFFAIVENIKTGECELRISDNNGEYFNPTGFYCEDNAYFYSDPSNKNIVFASNLRSEDGGQSWKTMTGCDYVLSHNPVSPNELFGVNGTSIVVSYDKGNKWHRLVNIGTNIHDLSYDYLQSALYITVGDKLVKYYVKEEKLEDCISSAFSNQFGENIVTLVECDPLYPNVVYAAGRSDGYVNNSSVLISENGGKNWYVISSTSSNQTLSSSCSGGLQPVDMILSSNRELVVFSAEFGIHKFSAYHPE